MHKVHQMGAKIRACPVMQLICTLHAQGNAAVDNVQVLLLQA